MLAAHAHTRVHNEQAANKMHKENKNSILFCVVIWFCSAVMSHTQRARSENAI